MGEGPGVGVNEKYFKCMGGGSTKKKEEGGGGLQKNSTVGWGSTKYSTKKGGGLGKKFLFLTISTPLR